MVNLNDKFINKIDWTASAYRPLFKGNNMFPKSQYIYTGKLLMPLLLQEKDIDYTTIDIQPAWLITGSLISIYGQILLNILNCVQNAISTSLAGKNN